MFCKTITSHDLDGNEIKEDYWFHLSHTEIVKWLTQNGDYTLDKLLNQMLKERKAKDIMNTFEQLILMSYGERSLDNRRFIKDQEKTKEFMQTDAYNVLFMELMQNPEKAGEFINGIIPADVAGEVSQVMKDNPDGIPENLKEYVPKQWSGQSNQPTNSSK